MSSTCKGVVTELNDFPIMLSSFSLMISNATIILFAILPSNNAPGTITGSVFHQQSINNLKSPYVLSLSRSPDQRERYQHLQKLLWRKQDSNLQPQGYDPCELPIAPFRSMKYAINTSYSANIVAIIV